MNRAPHSLPRDQISELKPQRNIRAVAILQGNSITGAAKAVLEFGLEAAASPVGSSKVELSVMLLSGSREENALTKAIRRANIGLDVLFEDRKFDWSVIPELRRAIEVRRPDVIWSNSVKSHFLVRLGKLNRSAKWVAFHHGYTALDMGIQFSNQLDRWSLRAADRVLTVCKPFAKDLESKGIQPSKIFVQHMPVRPFQAVDGEQVNKLRRELGIDERTWVLLSVGRLSAEKGHADLVRAFHAFRERKPKVDIRLILVGEGPERPHLASLCKRFGFGDCVGLVGQHNDVRPYYSIANLFVLPSHSEGSPNALLEAMSAGIPVIATSAGGIPELVTNERDALLVEKRNVPALTEAILLVFIDAALGRRLSGSGLGAVSRHTPEAYYRSITGVFEEALPGQPE
jgi:glycosyltransferase involved in cell wall biosynthesis